MIRYENAQYWRPAKTGSKLEFPSDNATQVHFVVKSTGGCVIRAQTMMADGDLGEPFLVAVAAPGDEEVRIRHGAGLLVEFEVPKGELWVYDDREPLLAEAFEGESFTRFEKVGNRMEDPVQVLIHRDQVRKKLERMAQIRSGEPTEAESLRAELDRMNERLEQLRVNGQTAQGDGQPQAEAAE